ncbi:MAG: formylglycine-generating enzyme family protein [Planctomycetota bacterium]|nr:formylglycine-generating enzyme family protein [Planctomycetota bacterium]
MQSPSLQAPGASLVLLLLTFGCGGGSLEVRPEPGQGTTPQSADQAEAPAEVEPTTLVAIPSGTHRPLYPGKDEPKQQTVAAFLLERHPVTNAQFLDFVWANPKWRRSAVPALFADESYLAHWPADLELPPGSADSPATQVSWYAARAYAEWRGRRLPTLAEWEYVAAASETAAYGREDPSYNRRILDWYAERTPAILPAVGLGPANHFGVTDLHGLVWEWVDDFNTALVTGESRGDSGLDRNLFCGSGSIGVADPSDYAAFMRFAFRSSLAARYSVNNLGFRCAVDQLPSRED